MDVETIMDAGMSGINQQDIMNTVTSTVNSTLQNSGFDMNNINPMQGYVSIAIAVIVMIWALRMCMGFVQRLLVVFVIGAFIMYNFSFNTPAGFTILPLIDQYAPGLLTQVENILSGIR